MGVDTKRGWGTGSSRKLKLITKAFRYLGLPSFDFHNIKRGYYIFPNVKNLFEIINSNQEPFWFDRDLNMLVNFWKERWCIPRSKRKPNWQNFDSEEYFNKVSKIITYLRPI